MIPPILVPTIPTTSPAQLLVVIVDGFFIAVKVPDIWLFVSCRGSTYSTRSSVGGCDDQQSPVESSCTSPSLNLSVVVSLFDATTFPTHNFCDQLREPHSASSFKNGTKTGVSFFNLPALGRLPPPELWPAPARSPRFSGVLGVVVGELFRSGCFRGDSAVVSGRVRKKSSRKDGG